MSKTVVVACDHAGFELKKTVIETAESLGFRVLDVGTYAADSVDFPDFAQLGAEKILNGEADLGIFMCGSGVGVSLAASKIPGIYACVCHDTYSARQGVEHDGMNVLCLGARIIGSELCKELVKAYLNAEFNQAANQIRRLSKIKRIEAGDLYLSDRLKHLEKSGQSLYLRCDSNRDIDMPEIIRQIEGRTIRGVFVSLEALCDRVCNPLSLHNRSLPMAANQWDAAQLFAHTFTLTARKLATQLKPIYNESGGQDGFALIEYATDRPDDPERVETEIRRLWKSVNRPNLIVALPATETGIKVGQSLIQDGINIAFSAVSAPARVEKAADSFLSALEKRVRDGKTVDTLTSCLIFEAGAFENDEEETETAFSGELDRAYRMINEADRIFQNERTAKLRDLGAKIPRVLWISPEESGIRFQNRLIRPNTIAAMTNAQISAFRSDGELRVMHTRPTPDFPEAANDKKTAENLFAMYKNIEEAKITAMIEAYQKMSDGANAAAAEAEKALGVLAEPIRENSKKIQDESIISRMFAKDPTVWTFDTQAYAEIRNRLGWLDVYETIEKSAPAYREIRESLARDGIRKALLIGMGGSSLAPEVLALTFPEAAGLKLRIIDSTDPGQVLEADDDHPLSETVVIVASKSGGTAEIRAVMDYFYAKAKAQFGEDAGSRFIAITDPGTLLERTAKELNFRNVILSDPSIGGRFSVLSPFGIVPAALIGLNLNRIYQKVSEMAKICAPSAPLGANEGAALGVFLGSAALAGRDKITILTDRELVSFGSWLEQLVAESSGKLGRGIVPVDIEPELAPENYASDRAFVYLDYVGEKREFVKDLIAAGQPVLTIRLNDRYDLFREFYRWEIAVSVACAMLNVNAFDQPNVQDSKTRTVAKVNDYKKNGKLEELPVSWSAEGVEAFFDFENAAMKTAKTVKELLRAYLKLAKAGEDYVAINAYIPRNDETLEALQAFREEILTATNCATTLGFGPRFQHSTGQLHKGGANNGVFIQIVADSPRDAEIPGEGMTFATFERAQALGDFEALLAMERRALRLNLGNAPLEILK